MPEKLRRWMWPAFGIGLIVVGAMVVLAGIVAVFAARGALMSDDATAKTAHAPASLTGKTVLLGRDGGVYALDAATGATRWRYPAPGGDEPRLVSPAWPSAMGPRWGRVRGYDERPSARPTRAGRRAGLVIERGA